MIVVRVELYSVVTGWKTELARMEICNTGDLKRGGKVCDYVGTIFRGRSRAALDKRVEHKAGQVNNWRRHDVHVWNLVAKMLSNMGYGQQ